MAIDNLILCLLFISFTINLLALCAFCMTPSLRTTAGRFIINLLIVNIAGCLILASTLIIIRNIDTSNNDCLDIMEDNFGDDQRLLTQKKALMEDNRVLNKVEQLANIFEYDWKYLDVRSSNEIDEEVIELQDRETLNWESRNETPVKFIRLWSIDLAAALGGLSVLVVVGDTWMAVRDPLRYHGRVSKKKAWILIALNWALGILFGIMSACWELDSEVLRTKRDVIPEQIEVLNLTMNIIFSKTFAYIYFVIIILLPFIFVCGMYWRIFSEAKENGQRMCSTMLSPMLQMTTPLLNKSSPDLLVSDRLQAFRQIYSTPYLPNCNFMSGFEATTNLRYIAYQALKIQRLHASSSLSDSHIFPNLRKETRAARISILVVVMFLISYLPYGFLALLQGSQMIMNFPYSTQLAVFLVLQANICSPFIFAYRYKRVRHGITRLFGFDTRSKKFRQQPRCRFLSFVNKISIKIKRNGRKLSKYSSNSCKYLKPMMAKNVRKNKSLKYNKYEISAIGIYLSNTASVQSGIIFGNIGVFNSVAGEDMYHMEYDQ